ncbi:MAG TPA: hypothetical protein VG347_18140 [Verrucomicrobiae bacterium]|nr:hypothetical protein [Verrucomicrobiae bacterium]
MSDAIYGSLLSFLRGKIIVAGYEGWRRVFHRKLHSVDLFVRHFFTVTFLLILAGSPFRTEAATTYRIGDVAAADVTTPVALEVPDAAATAALRAAKAKEVPVVFRSFPVATNGLTVEFLAVFTRAQANFLSAMAASFHSQTVTAAVIGSPEFGTFFTAFNEKNPHFPVTVELAAAWAQGGDGAEVRDRLLAHLQQVSAGSLRPDELPEGFLPGKMVRLVPVTTVNQKLSLYEVQRGRLVPGSELMPVAQAQKIFIDGFPATEQPYARAVAVLLKPNCFPDAPFTELVSGIAVSQLVATEHIEAGETILHRGDRVDEKAKAALDLMAAMPAPAPVIAKAPLSPTPSVKAAVPKPVVIPTASPATPTSRGHIGWLILVLAGISIGALLFAGWQALVGRKQSATAPAPASTAMTLAQPADQVANMAQGLRDAIMQELAWQRRELLISQQAAAEEISSLVRRLDDLQLPMQDRERTYEARIKALEEELAARTEENRELLKLKLESVRRQLQTERAANTNN